MTDRVAFWYLYDADDTTSSGSKNYSYPPVPIDPIVGLKESLDYVINLP
jgi:hypothetical protein